MDKFIVWVLFDYLKMTPLINPTIKFDNVIINLNSFRIMGKIVKNQPFKSE